MTGIISGTTCNNEARGASPNHSDATDKASAIPSLNVPHAGHTHHEGEGRKEDAEVSQGIIFVRKIQLYDEFGKKA